MKRFAIAAVAVVLALPGAAAGERAASAVSAKAPPRTVLALESSRNHEVLVRLDGRTLRPLGRRKVALDGHAGAWAFSPDGRKIAFGVGEALGLNLVDSRKMRRAGRVTLANGDVTALAWPTANRIVGVEQVAGLFVVDPLRRRLLRSERLDGWLQGFDRVGTSVVLLVAPEGTIGAPRLIAVDPNGATRSVTLDRLRAGTTVTHDEPSAGGPGESRLAGLAVDAAGNRAFVVGAAGDPIAEIDLTALTVAYRVPTPRRSFLGRVRDWLEPAAAAKVPVAGSSRQAAWLGGGLLAYSGVETAVVGETATRTPAGLAVVDTRDWSLQVLDERSTGFGYTAGMLLATGERSGLTGFTMQGVRSFELFPNETVWVWHVLEDRAFVEPQGRRLRMINALTGRVLGTRRTLPRLLYGS